MPVISATREVETGKITFLGQPRQKVRKTPSQPTNCAWKHAPVTPAMQVGIGRRFMVPGQLPGKKIKISLKNN
jgi:hypothetical protein